MYSMLKTIFSDSLEKALFQDSEYKTEYDNLVPRPFYRFLILLDGRGRKIWYPLICHALMTSLLKQIPVT